MKTTKPYPFQAEGVAQIAAWNGVALLADEMGLGKSLQALLHLHNHPELRPAVIVCPASLKYAWEFQAKHHVGLRSVVLEGTKPERTHLRGTPPLYIINYDILKHWVPWLRAKQPKAIIIDEGHYVANRRAQRSRAVKQLARKIKHRLILTGTPLTNKPAELWFPLNILRPDVFPSFWQFAQEHCKPERNPWGWTFNGAERLPQLHHRLKQTCMIRRLKKHVLKDLPAKVRTIVPLEIKDRRQYTEAVENFRQWAGKHLSHGKAKRAVRAEQLTRIGYLRRLAAELKLGSLMDWIDGWLEESDGKLIVFGVHRAVLHPLRERYRGMSVLVDGTVTGRKRQRAVDEFNKRDKVRLFLGNIKAAGVGWSCTSASTVAFAELPWSPGDLVQAEDRIHGIARGRIGQKAQIVYLVGRNTIEERLCEILQRKQGVVTEALDGKGKGESLNVFDLLTRALAQEKQR